MQPYIDIDMENEYGEKSSSIFFLSKILLIFALFIYFVHFELEQFRRSENLIDYFSDVVNIFEWTQYSLNMTIILMFLYDWWENRRIMSH